MAIETDRYRHHGVVLLAAGSSSRLGFPKALLLVDGRSLLARAAAAALATGPLDAVVVLRAGDVGTLKEAVEAGLRPVICERARDGMGSSLVSGLASLHPEVAGALVLACDQPDLHAAHLSDLVCAWSALGTAAASGYAGVVGVPALLPRSWWRELASFGTDRGARDLLRARRADVVVVTDESLARDVDRPEDAAGLGADAFALPAKAC